MKTEEMLSRQQLKALFFAFTSGVIIYNFMLIANFAGRACWLAFLIGVVPLVLLTVWVFAVCKSAEQKTVFDIIKSSFGKTVQNIVLSIYLLIVIIPAVIMINLFVGATNVFILKNTPGWIIMLLVIVVSLLFAKSGLVTLSRIFQVILILGIVNYFLSLLPGLAGFKIENVIPISEDDPIGFLKGITAAVGILSETVLPIFIVGEAADMTKEMRKSAIKGEVMCAVLYTVFMILEMGILNINVLKDKTFAGISVASLIQIGDFIRGLEIFIMIVYHFLCVIKVSVILYCMKSALTRIKKPKNPDLYVIISSIVVFVAAAVLNSYNVVLEKSLYAGWIIYLPFSLLVLILATIGVFVLKRKGKRVK